MRAEKRISRTELIIAIVVLVVILAFIIIDHYVWAADAKSTPTGTPRRRSGKVGALPRDPAPQDPEALRGRGKDPSGREAQRFDEQPICSGETASPGTLRTLRMIQAQYRQAIVGDDTPGTGPRAPNPH